MGGLEHRQKTFNRDCRDKVKSFPDLLTGHALQVDKYHGLPTHVDDSRI